MKKPLLSLAAVAIIIMAFWNEDTEPANLAVRAPQAEPVVTLETHLRGSAEDKANLADYPDTEIPHKETLELSALPDDQIDILGSNEATPVPSSASTSERDENSSRTVPEVSLPSLVEKSQAISPANQSRFSGVVSNPYFRRPTVPSDPTVELCDEEESKNELPTRISEIEDDRKRSTANESGVVELTIHPKVQQNGNDSVTMQEARVQCPPAASIRAMKQLEYGNQLARRGATATAKEEFIKALGTIAEGRDAAARNNRYSQQLRQALMVLDELRDFYTIESSTNPLTDVAFVVSGHNCGIFDDSEATTLNRQQACDTYVRAFVAMVSDSCGESAVASRALSALGKLCSLQTGADPAREEYLNVSATAMHTAAMRCDPLNAKSANELGVLLAKAGDFERARQLMMASIRVEPTVEAWTNLANVDELRGDKRLAQIALGEAEALARNLAAAQESGETGWAPPEAFGPEAAGLNVTGRAEMTAENPNATPVNEASVPNKSKGSFKLFKR